MIKSCVILGVTFLIAVTEGVQYLGCFRERSLDNRLFNGDIKNFTTSNSHEVCIDHCDSKGFLYAGVQFGKQCFCSNNRPSKEWLAKSEDECNMPCSGDPSQVCGAHRRMGVFSLVDPLPRPTTPRPTTPRPTTPRPTTPRPTTPQPATVPSYLSTYYLGCHANGALREALAQSTDLSLESCKNFCEANRYRYFGTSGGTNCVCGNDIVNNRIDERECRVPCNGARTQLCGGLSGQLSVYRTSIIVQVKPVFVPAPQPTQPTKKPKKNKKKSSSSSSSSSSEEKKNKKNKNKKNKKSKD